MRKEYNDCDYKAGALVFIRRNERRYVERGE